MAAGNKQKLIVVLGPTATGKTDLAIHLARRFGGEIISADSMQIYRGLDSGTAKATVQEQQAAPHHLIDICDPQQRFSVADYLTLAREKITEIAGRGAVPIIAGGTGLYISSLIEGIRFLDEPADDGLRARLVQQARELGGEEMYRRLEALDPQAAAVIHPHNEKRVLRALELYKKTGRTITSQREQSRTQEAPYNPLLLGLNFESREQLYQRIGLRIDRMVEQGVLEEARRVYENQNGWITAAQAIGYKEFFPYFEGTATLEACVDKLKQATRNYAKRQLTWFRRMERVNWCDALCPDADELVARFLGE